MRKSIELRARQTLLAAIEDIYVYGVKNAIEDQTIEEKEKEAFEKTLKSELRTMLQALKD
jgi:hypothetical protein